MRLDVYSHGIAVTDLNQQGKEALFRFCMSLVQYRYEKVRGKMRRVADRTYAGAFADRSEFRFHVNQLDSLIEHLSRCGIRESDLTIVHHKPNLDDFPQVEHKWISPKTPRENQPGIIDYVLSPGTIKMVTLQTGKGKATANDTLVRIPGAWKRMGAIKIGDEVISRDGTATKVIGVYPQGELQLYRVTFWDGRSVETCGEHLWQSFYVNTSEGCRWQVRNTLEMKRLIEMPNPRVYIPLPEPEECDPQFLSIDPYLLGVIIGDGSISQGGVTISTPDQFIVDEVNRVCPKDMSMKLYRGIGYGLTPDVAGSGNPLIKELRDLNMWGCLANDKFIPPIYLNSSIEQRLHLIQGLMDTDGTVQKSGSLSYSTVSEQLAKDVQYLVRSLGGIAAIRSRQTHYNHKGEKKPGQLCYEVDIRHKRPSEFLRLPRKKERTNDNGQYNNDLKLRVKSIEPSRIDHATCIAVDHPEKLFVVQDFIVTHNTFCAMWCMWKLGLRTVFIFKGGFSDRWVGDLEKTFDFGEDELLVIRGAGGLIRLMDMALDGTLNAKVIIVTNRTMYDYLKDHEANNGNSELYPVPPDKFYEVLGIGFRVMDEVHMEFHLNYRQDLYTHTLKSLSLSATLTHNDRFMNQVYDIAYPVHERNDGGGYHAYINAVALTYTLSMPKIYRYKGGQGGYSHNAFEQSMMSKKDFFPKYLSIFDHVVKTRYLKKRQPGMKMLIFCASIELCVVVTKYLSELYPDLVVKKYTEEDDYSVLEESDITVSTVLSAGTAVDIPNLLITFMSTSINSRQSNEQALGRTRELVDYPGVTPEFVYLVCEDIQKQMEYHVNKIDYFRGKVLSHQTLQLPFII